MDWLHLPAVQGTLKSLLQHHSSKASILRCSAFFIVRLSHPYMTTGKTIGLTRRTFVGNVMSLLFNMSRLVTNHASIQPWERLGCTNHLQFSKAPHGVLREAGLNSERQGTDSTQFSWEVQFLEKKKVPLRLPPGPPAP